MINLKKLLGLEFYTSPTDEFLAKYDQSHHGLSHAQHKEKVKYAKIAKMRDHVEVAAHADKFWDKF